MPLLDLRRIGDLLDRFLRPERAAKNAEEAASEATQTVVDRQVVERDVDAITDSQE